MTAWYRTWFLFSSFGPLYLLLGVGLAVQHDWKAGSLRCHDGVAMAVAAASFIASILVFLALRSGFNTSSPLRFAVEPVESLDESVLSYMLSYIPPLMIDDLSSLVKIAPAVIFYAVLILILVRTESSYINPYFLLFGYRMFRVKLPTGRSVVIITPKSEVISGEVVTIFEIQPSKLFYAS